MRKSPKFNNYPGFLPGSKFGEWTIVEGPYFGHVYKYMYRYRVRCSCGNECVLFRSGLQNNRSTRCRRCFGDSQRVLLTPGNVYGKLTVMDCPPEKVDVYWSNWMQCSCGRKILCRSTKINRGRVLSCGKCRYTKGI